MDIFGTIVETPLENLGLLNSPLKRFLVVGLFTRTILGITKPRGLFDEDGNAYPAQVLSSEENAVPLSADLLSGFIALASVVFV
jgi:hypothetical protein